MQANLLLRNFRPGIALMMSSAHCSSHIVLICIVVNYGLTLRKVVKSSYTQATTVCFVDFSVFLNHIVPVTCLFLEVFLPLLNFCVNLSIDLKTELSLVQTLSLQHVYHH